jgi:hypothetical protein
MDKMQLTYDQSKHKLREMWDMMYILAADIAEIEKKLNISVDPAIRNLFQQIINKKENDAPNKIDIKKYYLVEFDAVGNIAEDENGEKKISPLYNEDNTKTSIVWDKTAKVWRFFAVYAGGTE